MNVSPAQIPQAVQAKIQTFIQAAGAAGLQAMGINPNNTGQAPRGQTVGSPTNSNNTAGATTGGSPNGRPNPEYLLGLDTIQANNQGQGTKNSAQSGGQRGTTADLTMLQGRAAMVQAINAKGPPPVEERSPDGGEDGGQDGGAQDAGGDEAPAGQHAPQGSTLRSFAEAA